MSVPRLHEYAAPLELPEQHIAILVLALAIKDARRGRVAARLWLRSAEAAWWAGVAGLEQWPGDILKDCGL